MRGGHVAGGVEGVVVDVDDGAQRLGGRGVGVDPGPGQLQALLPPGAHRLVELSVFSPDWAAKEAMRRVLPAFLAGLDTSKIGRASCRERV